MIYFNVRDSFPHANDNGVDTPFTRGEYVYRQPGYEPRRSPPTGKPVTRREHNRSAYEA